ncbi:hypothetical protein BD410DRAFT_810357 [Rickenella mellea]|uniref:Uncharacterized protein n=1 Tax=Rickenella mellea TaxID=50990 RepID=A0A4Y7PEB2_9AGAM|nr:hypothetical protein BD410DRAFT_810357 [Rickenella mellea]
MSNLLCSENDRGPSKRTDTSDPWLPPPMVRPCKHKTEKERIIAARSRRKEWYHRNRRKEAAKSLERYHLKKSIDSQPQRPLPKPQVHSPNLEPSKSAPSSSVIADAPFMSIHCPRLETGEMLASARLALHGWHVGEDLRHIISNMRHIVDVWTGGSLRAWGQTLYLNIQPSTDNRRAELELQPYVTFGQHLQEQFDEVSRRSFQNDPSGQLGIWTEAQLVQRQISRAVDIVEEFCLILRDGGIASLQRSFIDCSLNFQLL